MSGRVLTVGVPPVRAVSRGRVVLLVAAVLTLVVDVAYVVFVRGQDSFVADDVPRVTFFAACVGGAGLLTLAATVLPVDARLPMQGVAAAILLATGFLGMFSIGLPLFLAGVLTACVTTYDAREAHEGALRWAAFSAVGSLLVLAAGIALT